MQGESEKAPHRSRRRALLTAFKEIAPEAIDDFGDQSFQQLLMVGEAN